MNSQRRHSVKQLLKNTIATVGFSASFFLGYPSIYAQGSMQGYYQSPRHIQGCGVCQTNQQNWYPAPVAAPVYYTPQSFPSNTVIHPSTVINETYGGTIVEFPSSYPSTSYPTYPSGEVIIDQQPTILSSPIYIDGLPVSNFDSNGQITGYPIEGVVVSGSGDTVDPIGQLEPILSSPSDIDLSGTQTEPDAAAKLAEELKRSEEEVAGLQTVVADLKVELKSANERVYATERNAKQSIEKAQKETAAMKQRVEETEKELAKSKSELEQVQKSFEAKIKEFETASMKGESQLKEKLAGEENLKEQLEELKRESSANEKRLKVELDETRRKLESVMAKVKALDLENQNAQKAFKEAQKQAELAKAKIAELEKQKLNPTPQKAPKRGDAKKSDDKKPETPAADPKAKNKKPASPDKKPDMKGKNEGARKEDAKKPDAPKSKDKDSADKNKPKFDAEEQIAKLEKSMNRQIEKAENEVNEKLEKELKALNEEGISKEHPKAVQLTKKMKEELDKKIKEIRERVQERIERIRAEAARRRAS